MQIRLGEHVLTSDGQDAGPIDKVVLNPDSGAVTSVLLREGVILHHDVQVTLDRLSEDASGQLRLALPSDRLDELPRFDESLFKTPPADIVLGGLSPGDGSPAGGMDRRDHAAEPDAGAHPRRPGGAGRGRGAPL